MNEIYERQLARDDGSEDTNDEQSDT